MVEAIKQNFPQREIADAAFRYQQEVDRGERMIVGVNAYRAATTRSRSRSCASTRRSSASRSAACRRCGRGRDGAAVEAALADAARGGGRRRQPDGPAARLRPRPLHARARSSSRCSGCSAPTPRRRSSEMKLRAFAATWTVFTMLAAPALLLAADEVPRRSSRAGRAPVERAARRSPAAPAPERRAAAAAAGARAAGGRAAAAEQPAPEPAAAPEPEADAEARRSRRPSAGPSPAPPRRPP